MTYNPSAPAIQVVSDTATPALRDFMEQLGPDRFAARAGPALEKLTMVHLARLGSNVRGWPTTKFYEKFSRKVRWLPYEGGVAVAVFPIQTAQNLLVGLHMRVFGGTIKPKNVCMLAIPISPVSYGHVPSDFPNLFLLKTLKGAYLCQRGQEIHGGRLRGIGSHRLHGNAGRRLHAELNFLFILKGSVTQAGNREVLPSDEEYLETAHDAILYGGKAGGNN